MENLIVKPANNVNAVKPATNVLQLAILFSDGQQQDCLIDVPENLSVNEFKKSVINYLQWQGNVKTCVIDWNHHKKNGKLKYSVRVQTVEFVNPIQHNIYNTDLQRQILLHAS